MSGTKSTKNTNDGSLARTRQLVAEINRLAGCVEAQTRHQQGVQQDARTVRRAREQIRGQ